MTGAISILISTLEVSVQIHTTSSRRTRVHGAALALPVLRSSLSVEPSPRVVRHSSGTAIGGSRYTLGVGDAATVCGSASARGRTQQGATKKPQRGELATSVDGQSDGQGVASQPPGASQTSQRWA